MQLCGVRSERVMYRDDGRQVAVLDHNCVQRILRSERGLCDYHRDRLADVTDLVSSKHRTIRFENRSARAAGE